MAIFHTHAVAGSLGGILTGIFAEPKLCRIFYLVPEFHDGRAEAGFKQMGVQLLGIVYVVYVNVVVTSIICWLIKLVVPLRLSEEELSVGDDAIHGEEAYALWGDGEKYESASRHNSLYGANQDVPLSGKGAGGDGGDVEMA
ncbi:Ammonium transporter 2 member 5 [Linum perenne]